MHVNVSESYCSKNDEGLAVVQEGLMVTRSSLRVILCKIRSRTLITKSSIFLCPCNKSAVLNKKSDGKISDLETRGFKGEKYV